MNKNDLIEKISKNISRKTSGPTKASIEETLNLALDIIKHSVKKGDDVTLLGFGTFTRSKRKARIGRNPQTGKELEIPATTVPRFRPGKEFKELIQ